MSLRNVACVFRKTATESLVIYFSYGAWLAQLVVHCSRCPAGCGIIGLTLRLVEGIICLGVNDNYNDDFNFYSAFPC